MVVNERISNFVKYHHDISATATRNISKEIDRILQQKRLLVKSFMQDNRQLIAGIVRDPEDEDLYASFNLKLGRYFTDYFASNIVTRDGELIVDDFEGYIGEMCLSDLKQYIDTGQQHIRIHPNITIYHYDILVEFPHGTDSKILIITFNAGELANLLRTSTPVRHKLVITDARNDLIEITPEGSRIEVTNRLDYRLTPDEKNRVISSASIPGTHWHVIDMHSEGLFSDYTHRVVLQGAVVYLFFVIITALMSISLLMGVRRQRSLERSLLENNREIKALNEELEKLSLTDSLTGINNRRYFDIYAPAEFNKAVRLGIVFNISIIDIDYFKQYNDTYGHQSGDACLAKIAGIISSYFRRSSENISRYGGEEFIIMNLGDAPDSFTARLEQLSSAIRETRIEHAGSRIADCVTISAGVASAPGAGCDSVEALVRAADTALYRAKGEGRNRVIVDGESHVKDVVAKR